uniref:asparagine synthase (glutamine-hydrolyzing) n=1 Tax=Flavobacterium sp. TaxID=239 RepID=UPI0037BF2FFE
MCGIFGYYHRDGRSLDAGVLAAMGDAIRHRGPDDRGVHAAAGMAIGNQRLSIIDIQGGHQPFVSDDGQIVVVQNGEIFNHVELAEELARGGHPCRTHSDTEVLLRLYESEGIGFLHKLNGMFAFAILDMREQALYVVRDRIGVKPLYVHDDGRQLTFASEIKSILKAGMPRPAMDREALHHYLSFNYVPAPYTMYEGIRHLMPGHAMKVTRAGSQTWRWWDLAEVQPLHGRTEAEWVEEFNAILDDAVRLRLRSDVPFGAFLSGGVDSSTVVGLMARHMNEPVKTFCIGFHDPRYDEAAFAQAAADRFGTRHKMERVDPDMLALWPAATYH